MSSANEDLMDGKVRYLAPEHGKVVDNADPEGLHRIRAEIPGIVEKTQWAFPVGTMGGGSAGRGAWVVPDVGADVVVSFLGGDLERPIYQCGWWGKPPSGESEMPSEARPSDPKEAAQIQTIHETKRLKIWVDERAGKEQFGIQDKNDDTTFLQFDFTNGMLTISGSTGIILKSDGIVKIVGSQVQLMDRLVLPTDEAI